MYNNSIWNEAVKVSAPYASYSGYFSEIDRLFPSPRPLRGGNRCYEELDSTESIMDEFHRNGVDREFLPDEPLPAKLAPRVSPNFPSTVPMPSPRFCLPKVKIVSPVYEKEVIPVGGLIRGRKEKTTTKKITKKSNGVNECAFCKNNGEEPSYYRTHMLRDPRSGHTICPVLRAYRCPICSKTGDDAHTIKYCSRNKDGVIDGGMQKTTRNSTGRRRRSLSSSSSR